MGATASRKNNSSSSCEDLTLCDFPIVRTNKEWKELLTPEEYNVLRLKGNDLPTSGKYYDFLPEKGYFACKGCSQPLYSATSKYSNKSGWCAFRKCYKGAVHIEVDDSLGIDKIELLCCLCGCHLGFLFVQEGFGWERHSINSTSLQYYETDPPGDPEEVLLGATWDMNKSVSFTHPMGDYGFSMADIGGHRVHKIHTIESRRSDPIILVTSSPPTRSEKFRDDNWSWLQHTPLHSDSSYAYDSRFTKYSNFSTPHLTPRQHPPYSRSPPPRCLYKKDEGAKFHQSAPSHEVSKTKLKTPQLRHYFPKKKKNRNRAESK